MSYIRLEDGEDGVSERVVVADDTRTGRYQNLYKMLALSSIILIVFTLLLNITRAAPIDQGGHLQVYSNNIRFATTTPGAAEKPWSDRKYDVVQSIKFFASRGNTVVGLQEVLKSQLDDILELLGGDWAYYGVGRDGGESGEYSPVLYDTTQFTLLDSKTLWLSETPDVPSKGWDAALPRIATLTQLKTKSGGYTFNFYNTHLDHLGVVAREKSMALIAGLEWHDGPILLSGDFNSPPTEDAYKEISKYYSDTRLVSKIKYGFTGTYTGFQDEADVIIDFIFVKGLDSDYYGVLPNGFEELKFSDHRPVVAGFKL